MKYYHASSKRFKPGDIIYGNYPKKNYNFSDDMVYMTTSPHPHFTVADDFAKSDKEYFIYEVKPMSKVESDMWNELKTKMAEVVKKVGTVSKSNSGLGKYQSSALKQKGYIKNILSLSKKSDSPKPRYTIYEKKSEFLGMYRPIRGFRKLGNAIDYAKKRGFVVYDNISNEYIDYE